ncbi:MAG: hypothetical protein OXT65_11300 [Alphaproteobacteria bacterium]|nr:hypothetical protein [Alphaproteobacteria bacterium]
MKKAFLAAVLAGCVSAPGFLAPPQAPHPDAEAEAVKRKDQVAKVEEAPSLPRSAPFPVGQDFEASEHGFCYVNDKKPEYVVKPTICAGGPDIKVVVPILEKKM